MDKNSSKIGWISLLLLTATGLSAFLTARYSDSIAGQVACVFWLIGIFLTLLSCFQMGLERREAVEKLEFDELTKSRNSGSLFNAAEAENFAAKRSREQFERWFVPILTFVLVLGQVAGVVFLWRYLDKTLFPPVRHSMVGPSLFGLFALILFLVGKYSSAMARLRNDRLLRPIAAYVLFCGYLSAAVGIGMALVTGGAFKNLDLNLARAFCVLLGLTALETLISLILEIYRPRTRQRVERMVYEGRLVGLIGSPESLFTTAAQALDYQFGFKVSETWFYRFLQKALAWLILLQVLILFLSTSITFIGPGEQALLERFGKPIPGRTLLEPGPHWKFPWPIDKVHRYHTRQIQSFNVGFVPDPKRAKEEKTILWTVGHYREEFNLLVASRDTLGMTNATTNLTATASQGVNLLTVSIPIQFQITNLVDYVYKHTDARSLLEKLATREVVHYLVGIDFFDVMSQGRGVAANELTRRIQTRANELELGVRIVFVGLQDIHPPVKVAPAFEEVVGVFQLNQGRVRAAEGYRAKEVPLARAKAQEIVRQAEIDRIRRVSASVAKAAQFTNEISAFTAAPEVFRQRSYLEALSRGAAKSRKIVITSTNVDEVISLNLEDKLRPDFEDITVPPAR